MAILDIQSPQIRTVLSRSGNAAADPIVQHAPVGIGLPMCVQIVTIYTGDAPTTLFGGKPDMLVTSSVKGPATFEAAQRAINQIVPRTPVDTYLEPGAANVDGTSIVYYTPALQESELMFSFELCAEKFNKKALDQVTGMMNETGNIPMFFAAGQALVVGSKLVDLAGKMVKLLFETDPFLTDTLTLRIDMGGFRNFRSGFKLICSNKDRSFFEGDYELEMQTEFGKDSYRLIRRGSKEEYRGNRPYMILNVDGRERRDLTNFEPRIASAAILSRFYGDNQQSQGFHILQEALQLQNDVSYLRRIRTYRREMEGLDPASEKFQELQTYVTAYEKNILSEDLKAAVAQKA